MLSSARRPGEADELPTTCRAASPTVCLGANLGTPHGHVEGSPTSMEPLDAKEKGTLGCEKAEILDVSWDVAQDVIINDSQLIPFRV